MNSHHLLGLVNWKRGRGGDGGRADLNRDSRGSLLHQSELSLSSSLVAAVLLLSLLPHTLGGLVDASLGLSLLLELEAGQVRSYQVR